MNESLRYSAGARQNLTERFEGLVLRVYPDPATGGAPYTAGYGHTGADVRLGMTVTQYMADVWLATDLEQAENTVRRLVLVELDQDEYDALVDFVYNEGAAHFAGSTMLRLINEGKMHAAADEFEKWDKAGGRVMAGLLRRRQAEEGYFRRGIGEQEAAAAKTTALPAAVPAPVKTNGAWWAVALAQWLAILFGGG